MITSKSTSQKQVIKSSCRGVVFVYLRIVVDERGEDHTAGDRCQDLRNRESGYDDVHVLRGVVVVRERERLERLERASRDTVSCAQAHRDQDDVAEALGCAEDPDAHR